MPVNIQGNNMVTESTEPIASMDVPVMGAAPTTAPTPVAPAVASTAPIEPVVPEVAEPVATEPVVNDRAANDMAEETHTIEAKLQAQEAEMQADAQAVEAEPEVDSQQEALLKGWSVDNDMLETAATEGLDQFVNADPSEDLTDEIREAKEKAAGDIVNAIAREWASAGSTKSNLMDYINVAQTEDTNEYVFFDRATETEIGRTDAFNTKPYGTGLLRDPSIYAPKNHSVSPLRAILNQAIVREGIAPDPSKNSTVDYRLDSQKPLAIFMTPEWSKAPLGYDWDLTVDDTRKVDISKVHHVMIPTGCARVDNGAFQNWGNHLRSVHLPSTLRQIGQGAFNNCNLGKITIPASVRKIEDGAFANNPNLKEVVFEGDAAWIGKDIFKGASADLVIRAQDRLLTNKGLAEYRVVDKNAESKKAKRDDIRDFLKANSKEDLEAYNMMVQNLPSKKEVEGMQLS